MLYIYFKKLLQWLFSSGFSQRILVLFISPRISSYTLLSPPPLQFNSSYSNTPFWPFTTVQPSLLAKWWSLWPTTGQSTENKRMLNAQPMEHKYLNSFSPDWDHCREGWKGWKSQSQNIIASKQCPWTEQNSYTYELTTVVMGCAIIVQAQERPDLSMDRGAGHEISCLLLVTVGCWDVSVAPVK